MRKLTAKQKATLNKHNFKNIKKDKLNEIVKKGNAASIEKRQELKTIKEIINKIANNPIKKATQKNKLLSFGLDNNIKNYAYFVLLDKALNKGNIHALNKLLDYFEKYENENKSIDTITQDFIKLLQDTAAADWQ